MHPLWHLAPALVCGAMAWVIAGELADDVQSGLPITPWHATAFGLCTLATGISLTPFLAWTIRSLA